MGTAGDLEQAIAPVVGTAGLELVDLERLPGRIRITVDRPGGIDLDAISAATTAISRVLDHSDCAPKGRYELEVSSPGVERRLRLAEHFEQQLGAVIAVRTRPGAGAERRFVGHLVDVDAGGFRLEDESAVEAGHRIAFEDVERAHVVFDWRGELASTSVKSARAAKTERRRAKTSPPAGEGQQASHVPKRSKAR
ncbi:MAG: ribosome maturation factor RimP [Acidimicrobiales bacterium]